MFYEHLAGFTVLWVSLLIVRRLWRAAHPRVPASVSSSKRKMPLPLKPRTPTDCPVCGRPHPTSLWGNRRKAGVLSWSERKSPRSRRKTICTADHACPNPDCDYSGNTDATFHALVIIDQAG